MNGLLTNSPRRRIKSEITGEALVTADRMSKTHDSQLAFFKKLTTFHQLQTIFAPGTVRAIAEEEPERNTDSPGCESREFDDGESYLSRVLHFKELKPVELFLDNELIKSDTAAHKKLALMRAGKGARTLQHITAQGVLGNDKSELHDCFFQSKWSLLVGAAARSVMDDVPDDDGAELVELFSMFTVEAEDPTSMFT
ncbi:hypothetical protein C8R43DRAFT_946875 [Mycena crocata]|nr:hypothetical protein C8R43DRAFT_946875 [Mycena crocata]